MDRLLDKITSGRFIVTVMMSLTYCYTVSFIITKLSDKISGDFALGFIGGFSTSFMLIIQWYFQRENAVSIQQNREKGRRKDEITNEDYADTTVINPDAGKSGGGQVK